MDETAPLLGSTSRRSFAAERRPSVEGEDYIEFDPKGDPDNPLDWPRAYKNFIVLLLAFMAFTVTFTCIGVVPVATHIVKDLDGYSSKSASVLLVTIWELGEAAGPFVIAPLSELYGRWPVFNAANIVFIACVAIAGLSQSSHSFIAARFLNGCAVASNVLNPAIIGDLFPTEERGSPMSLIMLAPLLGGAVGPGIAGAIVQTATWRHIMWMAIGLAGAAELAFLLLFRETYKVTILQRRAANLRKETGIERLKTAFDLDSEGGVPALWEAIKRPMVVFAGSSVLQAMSLFGSILFSFFYIMSTTLPDILQDSYHLDPAQTGISFMTFICNAFLDRIYINLNRRRPNKQPQPENRLPLPIFAAFFMPFVVALYGLFACLQTSMALMLICVLVLGFTMLMGAIPVMSYIVDAFGLHSASALTATLTLRCLVGTFLPLATDPLVERLGYAFAFLILAGLCLAVAPIPVVVMRCGGKWRQKSQHSKDLDI